MITQTMKPNMFTGLGDYGYEMALKRASRRNGFAKTIITGRKKPKKTALSLGTYLG